MKNIIFLIFCLLVINLNAQQNNVANWTQHQFLDQVNDIAETEDDMWFATNTGLVRMNKTSFDKTIYHPYNSPLPGEHVEAVTVDADGQLFIGIYDNIMARFDGGDDWEIIEVPVDEAVLFANQMPLLFTIFIDDENEKWVGTNSGLLHYQTDGTWGEIVNDASLENSNISFRDVWDITQTDNGDLFISSFEIYKYDGTDFTNLSEGNGDLFSYVKTSIESNGSDVWFGNSQFLVARYSDDSWDIYESGENGLASGSISDLKLDQSGVPYVSYSSDNIGTHRFENGTWSVVSDAPFNNILQGINRLYFDEDDVLWFADNGEVFSTISTPDTETTLQESPLIDNLPRLVREATDGSVYCYSGTFSGGKLVKFNNPTDWEEIELSNEFTTINDMEVTTNSDLIVSTIQGLFQYQNESWLQISGFPGSIPRDIALDSENGIWVTTSFDGLHYYDGSTWETYTTANSDLSNDFMSSLSVDRNDEVWVVTQNQNLEHFNGTNWELFNQSNSILPTTLDLSDLYFDENNELWFPIFNSGIFHYDGSNWEEFILASINTLTHYRIDANAEGTLYAATSEGIYEFDDSTWQPFLNEENSLLLDERSSDLLIAQDNFFWMSTEEGLFIYDSEIVSAINNPEILEQELLTVYPNPTTDFISFKMQNADNQLLTANIYDNSGRLLRSEKMNTRNRLNVTDLPTGIYYLKVNGKEANKISKFIKK